MPTILLADDHQMFLDGLRSMIGQWPEYQILHAVANGKSALQCIQDQPTDIAILDITMPQLSGLETAKQLKETHPNVKVLLLTMHHEPAFVQQAMELNVEGYLLKQANISEFKTALDTMLNGKRYYSTELTDILLNNYQALKQQKAELDALSDREIEVLKLIAKEKNNDEIAETLFVSVNTVKSHRKNLLSKTGVRNSIGLVLYAERNGLLED